MSKIIIVAGGTAGHIYPAVSIIEYLKDNYEKVKILFIGTSKGMEKVLLQNLNINFTLIKASGFSYTNNFFKKVLIYLKFIFNFLLLFCL